MKSELQKAVSKLSNFQCESLPLSGFAGREGYEAGDEHRPFFTEAYLYNLLGKEDGRTLLALLHKVENAAGMVYPNFMRGTSPAEALGERMDRLNATTQRAFDAVLAERGRQDAKWGMIEQNPHTFLNWLLLAKEELEEAAQATTTTDILKEVVQLAAICVACLEQHLGVEKDCAHCRHRTGSQNEKAETGCVRRICKARSSSDEMVLSRPTHACPQWAERAL
jgi:hypothetical protein